VIEFVFHVSFVEQFTVTLWNTTIHPVVQYVRVPANTNYTVRDPTGQMILAEVRRKNITKRKYPLLDL
jgi:hypothetical protein